MTVESCDKSGKIVINHTFYENKTTHSATWEGQITYKSADKLIVEIKTTEYTKMPLNYTGSPKTIEFIDNYSKIVYDYITMNKKANNN